MCLSCERWAVGFFLSQFDIHWIECWILVARCNKHAAPLLRMTFFGNYSMSFNYTTKRLEKCAYRKPERNSFICFIFRKSPFRMLKAWKRLVLAVVMQTHQFFFLLFLLGLCCVVWFSFWSRISCLYVRCTWQDVVDSKNFSKKIA